MDKGQRTHTHTKHTHTHTKHTRIRPSRIYSLIDSGFMNRKRLRMFLLRACCALLCVVFWVLSLCSAVLCYVLLCIACCMLCVLFLYVVSFCVLCYLLALSCYVLCVCVVVYFVLCFVLFFRFSFCVSCVRLLHGVACQACRVYHISLTHNMQHATPNKTQHNTNHISHKLTSASLS